MASGSCGSVLLDLTVRQNDVEPRRAASREGHHQHLTTAWNCHPFDTGSRHEGGIHRVVVACVLFVGVL